MTNEQVVRRYAEAVMAFDFDALDRLRHPEWTAHWPQSGEVVHGSASDRQIMNRYPGGRPKILEGGRIVGSEDRWAVSPLGGAYRVAGEGENWWGEYRMAYPDGRIWWTVFLVELRDGQIYRETQYWAEPFEAPAWRADLVEKVSEG